MTRPTHRRPTATRVLRSALLLRILALAVHGAFAAPAPSPQSEAHESVTHFDIPADDAGISLRQFAKQAGEQIIFLVEEVQGTRTNAVHGSMSPPEALDRLLAGTKLSATRDDTSGALAVGRKRPPEKKDSGRRREEATPLRSSGLTEDIITLSPFSVSSTANHGYRASNSVSGSRFAVPIKDLPFALQAFTSDFIRDIHPETLYDIAMYSPGVSYRSTDFTNGNAELAIRGFNVAAGGIYSSQLLRDGMKGPPILDFSNVDRVEIVKGPASFLYGQLAPGGMVNVITKTPKDCAETETSVEVGSHGEYRGKLDTTGPIGRGLLYRAVGSYGHDIDYWKPYEARQWDFAPQIVWRLNDRTAISMKFEHFEKRESPMLLQKPQWSYSRSGLPAWASAEADPLVAFPVLPAGLVGWPGASNDPNLSGVVVPGLPRDFNYVAASDRRISRDDSLTTFVDIKVEEHWWLRASYAFDRNVIDMVFSGRPVSNPDINGYTAAYKAAVGAGQSASQAVQAAFPYSGFAMGRRWRWQTARRVSESAELQALGSYVLDGVSLRILAGGQQNPYSARLKNGQAPDSANPAYNPSSPLPPWDLRDPSTWNRTVPATFNRANPALTPFGTPAMGNDITRVEDVAAYGSTTWGFDHDRVLLLLALRHTESRMQAEHDFNIGAVPGAVLRTIEPQFQSAANTPQVALLYKFRPDVSLFGSYSESFVPGAGTLSVVDKSNPENWTYGSGAPIEPTRGKGYDVGVKTDLLGGRVSGTLTYFDVQNSNILTTIPQAGPNGTFYPTFQSGLQESKGLEADLTYSPTDRWQIYGSASVMNARIVTVTTPAEDARLLTVNTYAGYLALSPADQASWRNVWRFHHRPLQMTAPHSYNVWTKYQFRGRLKGLFVGGGANIIRDQTIFSDTDVTNHQNVVLVNAIAGLVTKVCRRPVTITLTAKNLTNREYLPSQNTQSRPREFIVSVETKL